jgi:hypothetical protein
MGFRERFKHNHSPHRCIKKEVGLTHEQAAAAILYSEVSKRSVAPAPVVIELAIELGIILF